MIYYVYLIRNQVDGKLYVGKTGDIQKRWKRHQQRAKKGQGRFSRAIRKHTPARFQLWPLGAFQTDTEASAEELLWILRLGSDDPSIGYNNSISWQYVKSDVRRMYRTRVSSLWA